MEQVQANLSNAAISELIERISRQAQALEVAERALENIKNETHTPWAASAALAEIKRLRNEQ